MHDYWGSSCEEWDYMDSYPYYRKPRKKVVVTTPKFAVGDKVRNINTGTVFNVLGYDKANPTNIVLEGYPHDSYSDSAYERVVPEVKTPLDALRDAVDNARHSGYTVECTVTKTVVTEESL